MTPRIPARVARPLLIAVLIASCASPDSSSSEPSPLPEPSGSATLACPGRGLVPNAGGKLEAPQVPGVGLVGWWRDKVLVSIGESNCVLDPTSGVWSDPMIPPGMYATDGRTLLSRGAGHDLVFVDEHGETKVIDLEGQPWLETWDFQGTIIPMLEGGYLLAKIPRLVTVSAGGALSEIAVLPPAALAFAGGGAPGLFAIGPLLEGDGQAAPRDVTLWDAASRRAVGTRPGIGSVIVERSQGGVFVWVAAEGRWWALLPDGSSHPASVPVPVPSESSVDRSGRLLYVDTAIGAPCDSTGNPPACRTELRDATSFDLLQAGPGPSEGPAWHGTTAAYLWRRPGNVLPVVVLLSPDGSTQFAVP